MIHSIRHVRWDLWGEKTATGELKNGAAAVLKASLTEFELIRAPTND